MTGALEGVRVIEAATLFAGPLSGMLLGDFGAEVIKVEHPRRPDPARGHGPAKDGSGLWWKTLSRNKRLVAVDLSVPAGAAVLRRLTATADVLIENFRPGTLERWGLDPVSLLGENPRLVVARVTGFGQHGPYAAKPGFGTLAEAMSGFAELNGEPGGPPLLPPLALADGVAGLATAFAVLAALHVRESSGRGQVVDTSLVEPLMTLLGPQLTAYDLLGRLQRRSGSRSTHNAPRNVYRTADDRYVAVSSSTTSVAARIMRLVGRPELVAESWFASGHGRVEHADEIDAAVAAWIAARSRDEVLAAFDEADAAAAAVYDAGDILADPHLRATGAIVSLDDDELGPLVMTGPVARLSGTPAAIRFAGGRHGADTDRVLGEHGLSAAELAGLRRQGAIA